MKQELVKAPIIPILATLAFIVLVGLFLNKGIVIPNLQPVASPASEQFVTINQKNISVKILKTNSEREKGLSETKSLDENSGMLFVFENEEKPQVFWMKGMLIPIDIIWIKDDKIVKIDKNVPIPDPKTPDSKLSKYSAGVPVNYVLEVSAGYSDKNSVKVGDGVTFSGI